MRRQRPSGDIIRDGGTAPALVGGTPKIEHGRTRSKAERLPLLLDDMAPSYQVMLSASAAQTIRREIRSTEVAFRFEPMEVGGWLLSDKRWPDRIVVATAPGEDTRFGRSAVSLGSERLEAIERDYPHLSLRGDYHLHPESGSELPSEIDRRAWSRGYELTGDYWVSIIALPARTGWEQPTLHGWVTTPNFTERLRIVER